GVDLADDERDLRVRTPGRGVVDDGDAGGGEPFGLGAGGRSAGGEQGDVQSARIGLGGVLDGDGLSLDIDGLPSRTGRVEQPQDDYLDPWVLGQEVEHDASDLPGCSDYSDIDTHRPVPPYTTASFSSLSSPRSEERRVGKECRAQRSPGRQQRREERRREKEESGARQGGIGH